MIKRYWMIVCFAVLSLCAASHATEQLELTSDVRMRTEPDQNASVAGFAPKGAIVPVLERQGTWYKIQHNNREGWIFHKFTRPARSRAGDIFTKQDVSMLPPTPITDGDTAPRPNVRYAQVLHDNALILERLDPSAPFIHKARKGEVFVLASVGASWCKVVYGDTIGYIKRASVEVWDGVKPNESAIMVSEAKAWISFILIGGALVLIAFGVITYLHLRSERKRGVYVQKNALILAKESKEIQYMLTNTEAPLERCFREIGFNVSVAKDSVTARNIIESDMPNIILVDWEFEASILTKIDNLFARMTARPIEPYFLFYNVPDPSDVPEYKALRHASFLGPTVSDRDIFKVVTPLIIHHAPEPVQKNVQKSVQHCALEGEIAGGNLLEVLQFIEIGSKTGCLMVETKGPFGLVYFRDGMIIYAAAAKGQGVEAVYAILNQPFGKFRFILNKQPKTANLCLPTLSVLMEWTKEKDEANRG